MTVSARIGSIRSLLAQIGRPVQLMEVCGTHTMSAFRSGLRSLLPDDLEFLSGPGCPVCVTPRQYLDLALAIAREPDTLVATFGDMIKVPGSESSLETARALGASVRIVYSPLDALNEAKAHPGTKVVFLGVGFETTVPAVAWSLREAAGSDTGNFLVLSAHKTMPRAMEALLSVDDVRVDGFLCPGHVSSIIGSEPYEFIAHDRGIPCAITGFEPIDMLAGMEMLLVQIRDKKAEVEIQYTRTVSREGNTRAQALIAEVMEACDAEWRGIGVVPLSGLSIRTEFSAHDAGPAFSYLELPPPAPDMGCICGDILRGSKTPVECPLFRTRCTPSDPVGACMVSSEGTCAAYYKFADR